MQTNASPITHPSHRNDMKRRLTGERLFLLPLLALALLLIGSVHAQTNTTLVSTNQTDVLAESHRRFIDQNRELLTFGLDRVPALQSEIAWHPLWQYIATLLYVVIAFVAAKLVDWIIKSWLRSLTRRTTTQFDDILVGLLDGPVKVIVFVLLLNIGLQLFDWPPIINNWLAKLTILAVGVSLLQVLLKAIDAMIVLWRSRLSTDGDYSFNQYFLVLVGKIVKSVIIVVAIFTVLGSLGIDIRAALASVSVIGLALGLAAQDTVSNLFGAAAVFIDKPFRIGDSVRIGDVEGSVEEMGLRSTRIRNGEGHLITVPNREMGNSRIVNISRRPTFRTAFTLGLPHSMTAAEVQKAIDTTRETFAAHPLTHDVTVQFTRITDASLNLEVVHWCKTTEGRKQAAVLQELNLRLKERFDAEGIRLATPTRSIVMSPGGESGTPSVAATRPGTSTTR